MDRRQRKTREAIFHGFTRLLSQKDFSHITVGEIIAQADIGRATFYAHFETKDDLLKAFCQELFCHIFDTERDQHHHRHIFECEGADSVFLHLFTHLQKNDNNILSLLTSRNNDLFLDCFGQELQVLIQSQLPMFAEKKPQNIPEDFWEDHILSTFTATLKWWLKTGMQESPETVSEYFFSVV